MCKKFVCFASVVLVFSLSAAVSYGQGFFDFDGGGDGTSWDDPNNWEQVIDPNGNFSSGNPAAPPDNNVTAVIPLAGVVVDNTMAAQKAAKLTVGTAAGAGSLTLSTGGSLTIATDPNGGGSAGDFNLGDDTSGGTNGGTFNMTGGTLVVRDDFSLGNRILTPIPNTLFSEGHMTMSDGVMTIRDDTNIRAGSSLTMTGGTINSGDKMTLIDGASLSLDGGDIISNDDIQIFGNAQATVDSGLWSSVDKLNFDQDPNFSGKLTINGGIVRTEDFNLGITDILTDFRGVVEINGDGVYEVADEDWSPDFGASGPADPNNPGTLANLSVGTARALIAQGVHFITSEVFPKQLGAFTVTLDIGEFYGNTVPRTFTQISVVPEPASVLLLGIGSFGLLLRRKRARKYET